MLALRKMTLSKKSGLNHELNNLEKISQCREPVAKVILATNLNKIVGWALLSREYSNFKFANGTVGFKPDSGYLFQVYVDSQYRRMGIGTRLFNQARKISDSYKIGVSPWNQSSHCFYNGLDKDKLFIL